MGIDYVPAGRTDVPGLAARPLAGGRGYPVLQETVGHAHWPLGEIVTPQLLPLPLGLATITYRQ